MQCFHVISHINTAREPTHTFSFTQASTTLITCSRGWVDVERKWQKKLLSSCFLRSSSLYGCGSISPMTGELVRQCMGNESMFCVWTKRSEWIWDYKVASEWVHQGDTEYVSGWRGEWAGLFPALIEPWSKVIQLAPLANENAVKF